MQAKPLLYALALAGGLAGCGDTTGEQIVYGAGAGAVGSALVGGHLLTGAAVGTAANVIYCKEFPSRC